MEVSIIGGGAIGLSCAYYLQKEGHSVTVIDRGNGTNNCSFGNAGYISPSHFIPLASPGIVAQGLKWMLNSSSPFYIKPRFSASLIKWGLKFWSNANKITVAKNAPHLYNILQLSRNLTIDLDNDLNNGMLLQQKGCFMLYRNEKTGQHEKELSVEAGLLGINAPVMSKLEIQAMEPEVSLDILGGVYFPIDCHLHPVRMMETLYKKVQEMGVKILFNHEVEGFESTGRKVVSVITDKESVRSEVVIIAAGAWLPQVTKKLGVNLLLQPGKGYSTTYSNVKNNLHHPAILVDDRVAMTPLGKDLRVGGTMELSGINTYINMNRVKPIISSANRYFTNLNLQVPSPDKVWTGLRPCSPDGLPFIGRSKYHSNVIVAGGHAMLGISLAAGTGYLVKQLVQNEKTEINIDAFRIDR